MVVPRVKMNMLELALRHKLSSPRMNIITIRTAVDGSYFFLLDIFLNRKFVGLADCRRLNAAECEDNEYSQTSRDFGQLTTAFRAR
jgi:hypothetical protein